MTRTVRPYGSWPSPVTPEALVAGAAAPGEAAVDGDDIWWSESRPSEGGRTELVRRRVDGTTEDVLAGRPAPDGRTWNARTGLLEYGGGAWCVESGVVTFAQWDDQRLHRLVADDPDAVPEPLTPHPNQGRGLRYGDLVALNHGWLLAVREAHPGEDVDAATGAPEPVHQIVAVPTDGSGVDDPSRIRVLVSGPDFVASPRPGPARLAWIRWDHPQMPWDGAELCVAGLGTDADGAPLRRDSGTVVAGGPGESVVQPEWGPDGTLWSCSDRSGWWNLHRTLDPGGSGPDGIPEVVAPVEAEVGGARWVAGMRWYAPLADGRLLVAVTADGATSLGLVAPGPPGSGEETPLARLALELGGSPATVVSHLVAGPGPAQAVVIAGSGRAEPTPVLLDLPPGTAAPASDGGRGRRAVPTSVGIGALDVAATAGSRVLRHPRDVGLGAEDISVPEPISFTSAGGRTAHAQLYRPVSTTSMAPDGERPPLVVMIHGGPTSAARPMLELSRQFWTSRGLAVVDVDYGGSTGYGRPYRQLLDGAWGVVDVEDCVAVARHLAAQGVVDGSRVVIRGGSAGGFTTLAALCTSDAFAAGTSLYGVADLAALAADTHKFESRYLDGLVGPWPEAADVYAARSPIHHLDRLATPILVLQGEEDAVVPPSQAEAVVAAVAERGLPHAYLLFAGEGHGFRQAETIVAALRAELAFYGQVLGFTPDDDLPPLPATATP
ncbi:MAG: alpha/beta hydrolase family protein [Iamia sp.]